LETYNLPQKVVTYPNFKRYVEDLGGFQIIEKGYGEMDEVNMVNDINKYLQYNILLNKMTAGDNRSP